MNKKPEQKGKILFINALKEVVRINSQNYLSEDNINKISTTYLHYKKIEGFSNIVSIGEVLKNNALLSLPLYVENNSETKASSNSDESINSLYDAWKLSSNELKKSIDLINEYIGGKEDA
jgi:type I restriction enzyme M protein